MCLYIYTYKATLRVIKGGLGEGRGPVFGLRWLRVGLAVYLSPCMISMSCMICMVSMICMLSMISIITMISND